MKIYTKSGDDGTARFMEEDRFPKNDPRFELLGTIDEMTSHIGLAKTQIKDQDAYKNLEQIQQNLAQMMAFIADPKDPRWVMKEEDLEALEKNIDGYQKQYPSQNKFVLPGENPISAQLDIVRTVTRRAERLMITVDQKYPMDLRWKKYMNRLSDFFYVLARYQVFKSLVEHTVRQTMNKTLVQSQWDLKQAKVLAERLEAKAHEMGLKVVIAITDTHGHGMVVHRMDDAYLASFDVALNKAYTAVALKMSTDQLKDLALPGESLYGIQYTNGGKIVIFGGGIPLTKDGRIIGGLGVSGGSAEQDTMLAQYGADLVKEE